MILFLQMLFRKKNIYDKIFPFKNRMLPFADFLLSEKRLARSIMANEFFYEDF